jgi:predicted enzyme related to lactoylglutathione lyase
MRSFGQGRPNTFGWTELNTRDLGRALPFYQQVFGWTTRESDMGGGQTYTEFLHDGESVAGAIPMQPGTPDEVPSFWSIYFLTDDVDGTTRRAVAEGGQQIVEPQDFPGGRFSMVTDPQGGSFGIMKMAEG